MTDQELRAWLENLPLLARLAETGFAPFGPDAEQVRAELHALIRRAKGSGYDVAEKSRDLLKGYAAILDDKVEDMKALRHNFYRDAGISEEEAQDDD